MKVFRFSPFQISSLLFSPFALIATQAIKVVKNDSTSHMFDRVRLEDPHPAVAYKEESWIQAIAFGPDGRP